MSQDMNAIRVSSRWMMALHLEPYGRIAAANPAASETGKVDHGLREGLRGFLAKMCPTPPAISRSLSGLIGAASDQRRFDGDVPVRCPRIGTHLVGRLDKALRRRALHPRQAHVEASREAERAPFGTEIDLGVYRVIGRQRDLHVARGELHRRLEARGPAGR